MIFVLFTALTLPSKTAEAERMAQGAGVPDTSLWYTPADLAAMAENYGRQDGKGPTCKRADLSI